MVPPAPGRFSMTMGCRSWGESLSVTVRAMMSVPLPGVNGTTILIGFEGQACAHAADCAAQSSPSSTKDLPSFPDILASREQAFAIGVLRLCLNRGGAAARRVWNWSVVPDSTTSREALCDLQRGQPMPFQQA